MPPVTTTAASRVTPSVAQPYVAELWRYPVKSLRGERLEAAELTAAGIPGDRLVHVRHRSGRVVTSRTRPGLLGLQGALGDDGEPLVDGHPWRDPAALAAVRTVAGADVDLIRDESLERFDILPLSILTDGAVAALGVDYRRLRPNLLLGGVEGLAERTWPGRRLRIGDASIELVQLRPRCVMTTFDPDTLEQDHGVLRRIVREFDGTTALDAFVRTPGRVRVGDPVIVEG
jgi:uncharacterized protein YcbX